MDVHCATCGEPWDTYHMYHDAVHETPAGLDWINHKLDVEDYENRMNQYGGLGRDSARRATSPPEPPAHEKWERKLTPFWREQFKLDGWEFGTSVVSILRCPCCKDNDEHPEAEERRSNVQFLSEMLEGDEDGQVAENRLALNFR